MLWVPGGRNHIFLDVIGSRGRFYLFFASGGLKPCVSALGLLLEARSHVCFLYILTLVPKWAFNGAPKNLGQLKLRREQKHLVILSNPQI